MAKSAKEVIRARQPNGTVEVLFVERRDKKVVILKKGLLHPSEIVMLDRRR